MAIRQTGMGLFHVSEKENQRLEVYYQPLTDSVCFQLMPLNPHEAVKGGFRLGFQLPYLIYKQIAKGSYAVQAASVAEAIAIGEQVEEAKDMLLDAFRPFSRDFPDFCERLSQVAQQAKRARKKAGLPHVRDAASEAYETIDMPDPVGPFGPFGRSEEAAGGRHPFADLLDMVLSRFHADARKRPRRSSQETEVETCDDEDSE